MYMLGGIHPGRGLKEFYAQDGDIIVWHYIDDYTKEQTAWENVYPNGTPAGLGTNDGGNGSGTGDDNTTEISDGTLPLADAPENSVVAEIKATVKDGAATATITEEALKDLIVEAKEDGKTNITLTITGTNGADSIELDLIIALVNDISKNGMTLTVHTDTATITFDNDTLKSIAAGKTDDEKVRIVVEDITGKADLNAKQKAKVGDNPVIDISVWVGNTKLHDYNGKITVKLPEIPKGVAPKDYDLLTVYYVDDEGNIQEMKDVEYNETTGEVIFATSHTSVFFVSEWINPFKDTSKADWFYRSIRFAYSNDLMTGTAADTFSPNSEMTRAMLVTILWRQAGSPIVSNGTSFTDVEAGQWYSDAIAWANSVGIVSGYGYGKFGTNDNVTREQYVTILYRFAKWSGKTTGGSASLNAYTDSGSISDWAAEAMQWAVGNGLLTGRTLTTLAPDGTANRAEGATLLQRFIENL
jgi:hypothetical protein